MPAPITDLIKTNVDTTVNIMVEPAQIAINSLVLLNHADDLSGYNDWITQTAVALSPDERHTNKVVLEGLHYVIIPSQSWPTFPSYIDHLATMDPIRLRDRIFDGYNNLTKSKELVADFDLDTVMASSQSYLDYLYERFPREYVDVPVETDAYHLLQNPAVMQQRIVAHLRQMWTRFLADEWARTYPMLQASVDAFNQIDFSQSTLVETAVAIIGKELPEYMQSTLENIQDKQIERVVFSPSPHLGPYLHKAYVRNTLWLLFGARLPEGTQIQYPDLSRSDMLVRLTALADDTRLRILQLIREENELCSQDIMNTLDLSQSATSRHLKQLSATGYLVERRRESAKCYQLNSDRIDNTIQALSHFLLG